MLFFVTEMARGTSTRECSRGISRGLQPNVVCMSTSLEPVLAPDDAGRRRELRKNAARVRVGGCVE